MHHYHRHGEGVAAYYGTLPLIDTVAPSYMYQHATKTVAGAAAELAATRKITKYDHVLDSHQFVPVAFETLALSITVESTLSKTWAKRLTLNTGDIRETAFLFQRLSTTIQRFNAVAFRGTFGEPDTTER